jgi:hypothetical protein
MKIKSTPNKKGLFHEIWDQMNKLTFISSLECGKCGVMDIAKGRRFVNYIPGDCKKCGGELIWKDRVVDSGEGSLIVGDDVEI